MEVILLERIEKLGTIGDVVKVMKNGYAVRMLEGPNKGELVRFTLRGREFGYSDSWGYGRHLHDKWQEVECYNHGRAEAFAREWRAKAQKGLENAVRELHGQPNAQERGEFMDKLMRLSGELFDMHNREEPKPLASLSALSLSGIRKRE